jgi:integrase
MADVQTGMIKAETGNKTLTHLNAMWNAYRKDVDWDVRSPFRELRLTSRQHVSERRKSVPATFIAAHYPEGLPKLSDRIRPLIQVMMELGTREAEITDLLPEDIYLKHEVPHIHIRAREGRELKNRGSDRRVPLVGEALTAFRENPGGFPWYMDRSKWFSAAANKAMRNNVLLPEGCLVYGLRHGWTDRARSAGVPEDLRKALMGHKQDGVTYGELYSLEERLAALQKIHDEIARAGL